MASSKEFMAAYADAFETATSELKRGRVRTDAKVTLMSAYGGVLDEDSVEEILDNVFDTETPTPPADEKLLPVTITDHIDDYDCVFAQGVGCDVPLQDAEGRLVLGYDVRNLAGDCPEDAMIERDLVSAEEWLDAVKLGMRLGHLGYTGFDVTTEERQGW